MAKKKTSTHNVHAMIVAFSVIAGLALAACQPQVTTRETTQQIPTPQTQQVVASPAPQNVMEGQVKGTMTVNEEVDSTLKEMDASLNNTNPSELNGSDVN